VDENRGLGSVPVWGGTRGLMWPKGKSTIRMAGRVAGRMSVSVKNLVLLMRSMDA